MSRALTIALLTSGARRRKVSASGSMLATQTAPMPMCAWRQPTASMAYCKRGGQIVPAR